MEIISVILMNWKWAGFSKALGVGLSTLLLVGRPEPRQRTGREIEK